MDTDERGPLLYAYFPIPANPMTVALLILVGLATFVLGPLAARPDFFPLGGLCLVPFALVVLALLAFKPSPTLVFEKGIEVSLPLWRRIRGQPRYIPWREVRDVYPRSYEVAGSFLSPFASSAGTLVHTGIGVETIDSRRLLIRFTPGSIRAFRAESQGYIEAMAAIRDRFARHGEPMVTTAKRFSDEQVLGMQALAREPLVPVAAVFLAFFLPPALVAATLLILSAARVELTSPLILLTIAVALLPPAWSMVRTLLQSERRNGILSDLAKYQEYLRENANAVRANPAQKGGYP